MSWDIVLFSSSQRIDSPENVDETLFIPTSFEKGMTEAFKNIKSNGNHREVIGDDFNIDYFVSDELETSTIMSLYGEKALFEITKVAKSNHWQIFDTGMGKMLDLENPSINGYEEFQAYLQNILNGD